MEFAPEHVATFREIFAQHRAKIAAFPGCTALALYQDASQAHVFYTHSRWEGPEALAAYRQSPLFEGIWAETKVLFSGKPQAYSLIAPSAV